MHISFFFLQIGKGPDAFFYVGKKGTEINSDGIRLPYPENSDQKLGEFNGETIKINLPKEIKFDEIGWLSVWCRKFGVDFGHLIFENYGSTNVNIDESEASKHSDYDGCNQDRGCFGLQEGCTSSSNCPAMVTYKYLQDLNQFQFKLHIKSVDSGRYVAVGFSNDPKMGDDLVIFCSTEDGASPQLSWNEGKSNKLGVQGLDLLQKISVSAVDGVRNYYTNIVHTTDIILFVDTQFVFFFCYRPNLANSHYPMN